MKETQQHIDELVRERLGELPAATAPAAGWDALERALDAPDDAHLRDALTGLLATEAAVGWQALERKLDHRTPADVQLANQLDALTPTIAAGSWDALAARMDRENEEAVDVIVSDGLARTNPGIISGWAALAARLELIGWRRSTVAAWKVTEGALLLCLLLLLFRFGSTPAGGLGPVVDLQDGFPTPVAAITTTEQVVKNADKTLLQKDVQSVYAGESTTVLSNEDVLVTKSGRAVIPLVLPTSGAYTEQGTKVSTNDRLPYLPETIESLAIRPLKNMVRIPSPMLNLAEVDHSVPVYYYVNGFVSPVDVNQVVTPGHTAGEFKISSERRYASGFTAGGLLDINKGKNTLQIGVIYSRRAYLPASLRWRYQDYFTPRSPVEGYSKFIYHAIEFPFSYKRTLSENDRWRVSARAGMSLSVIAKPVIKDQDAVVAKFEAFEEEVAEGRYAFGAGFLPSGAPPRPPQTDFSSEHELKDPAKGWLEGGSILANSSFYLESGVTVERIMNPRWSLYLSPSIGRVIYLREGEGVGPYRDRINLGSLRMGSRYRFGGKK